MKFQQISRVQSVGLVGVFCLFTSVNRAFAQVLEEQWPAMPTVVTEHPNNDAEVGLIPAPIFPPEAKAPTSDPLLSTTNPSQKIKGTLAYFASARDGEEGTTYHVIILRSLNGPRMLPVSHTTPPSDKGPSEVASYDFHEGEFSSGNPQFSPDGQVLLYQQSDWRPQYGNGSLYEWDMKAGKVRQLANRNIAYLHFFWSPDSRAIAYVSGGEESGKSAELNIVDRSTAKSQQVALPKGVSLMLATPVRQQAPIVPIAWASPNSLLFSGLPDMRADNDTPAHPNIYETTNGKTSLVVPDAYAPSPSPDGRWIACFGWPDADTKVSADELKKLAPPMLPDLYLVDRHSKKRFLVRALPKFGRRELMNGGPPQQILRWTPDSRHLILTEETYQNKGKAGEATATLSAVDIPSQLPVGDALWAQTLRLITTLHATDVVAYPRSLIHFGPLQISSDGNHLFLAAFQVTGQVGEPLKENLVSESSLQRVNLTDGKVDVVALFNTDRLQGFDWHEEKSAP